MWVALVHVLVFSNVLVFRYIRSSAYSLGYIQHVAALPSLHKCRSRQGKQSRDARRLLVGSFFPSLFPACGMSSCTYMCATTSKRLLFYNSPPLSAYDTQTSCSCIQQIQSIARHIVAFQHYSMVARPVRVNCQRRPVRSLVNMTR